MRNGGFIPAAEVRELGERVGREIVVTAWSMICLDHPPLTVPLLADYTE